MSEHRGTLLERDTKTHRSRVVEVPASVLAELRNTRGAARRNHPHALLFTTSCGDPVRLSNWRHRVWDPLAAKLGLPDGRRLTCSVIQRRVCSPRAVCRSRPHLLPSAMTLPSSCGRMRICTLVTSLLWRRRWTPRGPPASMRSSRTTESKRVRRRQAPWRAWISRGWREAVASRPRRVASDLHFWSGCRDLNPGPLDPQSSALTKLRHSPRDARVSPAQRPCLNRRQVPTKTSAGTSDLHRTRPRFPRQWQDYLRQEPTADRPVEMPSSGLPAPDGSGASE